MRTFDAIVRMAEERNGGADGLAARLDGPGPGVDLTCLSDDRILSEFSKRVFQAGFNWSVVEKSGMSLKRHFTALISVATP